MRKKIKVTSELARVGRNTGMLGGKAWRERWRRGGDERGGGAVVG